MRHWHTHVPYKRDTRITLSISEPRSLSIFAISASLRPGIVKYYRGYMDGKKKRFETSDDEGFEEVQIKRHHDDREGGDGEMMG